MKTLLVINSSGRKVRSVTRHLTAPFAERWRALHPDSIVVVRDVGALPPTPVNEAWIKAAFADSGGPTQDLRESEGLIEEIISADAIVMGVPMYNFGLPAQLKAYFDQVIRIGRTFAYEPRADGPYRPLLPSKPCTVITSVGNPELHPNGTLAHLNFLEHHLTTLWAHIGITDIVYIRADQELLRNADNLVRIEAEVDGAVESVWSAYRQRA